MTERPVDGSWRVLLKCALPVSPCPGRSVKIRIQSFFVHEHGLTPACGAHEQRPTGEVGLPDRPTDRPGYVRLAGTIPNSHAERRFVRRFLPFEFQDLRRFRFSHCRPRRASSKHPSRPKPKGNSQPIRTRGSLANGRTVEDAWGQSRVRVPSRRRRGRPR